MTLSLLSYRLRSERGVGIVTAMFVLTFMLMLGLAAYAQVDTQTSLSRVDRERESAFNLAEAALSAHIFVLSKRWPSREGGAAGAFPVSCDHATTDPAPSAEPQCPLPVRDVANIFRSPDFDAARTEFDWTVRVVDNDLDDQPGTPTDPDETPDPGPEPFETFYSEALLAEADAAGAYDPPGTDPPQTATWDRNGDGKLWVRAEAEVRGEPRILVAQVKVEEVGVPFPSSAISAGGFGTGNNGNDDLINQYPEGGGLPGTIYVRCTEAEAAANPDCSSYVPGQIEEPVVICYTDSPAPCTPQPTTAIPPEFLDILRNTAKQQNTYYDGVCPPTPEGPASIGGSPTANSTVGDGSVVFIENRSCTFAANDTWHSETDPGLLITTNGTLAFTGSQTFNGLIYAANLQGDDFNDQPVIDLGGNVRIVGAVAVDGQGTVNIGSTGNPPDGDPFVLQYAPNVLDDIEAFGTAGIIQNTWREIPAN